MFRTQLYLEKEYTKLYNRFLHAVRADDNNQGTLLEAYIDFLYSIQDLNIEDYKLFLITNYQSIQQDFKIILESFRPESTNFNKIPYHFILEKTTKEILNSNKIYYFLYEIFYKKYYSNENVKLYSLFVASILEKILKDFGRFETSSIFFAELSYKIEAHIYHILRDILLLPYTYTWDIKETFSLNLEHLNHRDLSQNLRVDTLLASDTYTISIPLTY